MDGVLAMKKILKLLFLNYITTRTIWSFNETLSSTFGIKQTFTHVRQSVAFDFTGTEVAANQPVYEVI